MTAATPTPTASPDSAGVISCRLPVLVPTTAGSTDPPGGWVTLPGGQYERDPTSRVGVLNQGPSYDWPLKRWVPVEPASVSPDGTTYLLWDPVQQAGDFVMVEVATGKRRTIVASPELDAQRSAWQAMGYRRVLEYTLKGIYIADSGIAPKPGLWLLDPVTGKVRQVTGTDSNYWQVAGGAAWTIVDSPSYQTVRRLDLTTGQSGDWYRFPSSAQPTLITVDPHGAPVIRTIGNDRVGLITQPDKFEELPVPAGLEVWSAQLAEPALWLPLRYGKGVALYSQERGVQVFKTETGPYSFTIAGGCFSPAAWVPKQADASWRALGG